MNGPSVPTRARDREGQLRARRTTRRTGAGLSSGATRGLDPSIEALRTKDDLDNVEVGVVMLATGWGEDLGRLVEGMAVVDCESGGQRHATSHNPGSGGTNRGIFQVDDGSHPITARCALDNFCSSRVAHTAWSASGWSIWACDTNPGDRAGAMVDAADALKWWREGSRGNTTVAGKVQDALGSFDPLEPLAAVAKVLGDIARFFVGLGELLLTPEGWLRLGKIVGGSILVLWGLSMFMKVGLGVNASRGTARAVARLSPAGRAARAAVPG